jgi:hypothetical protein
MEYRRKQSLSKPSLAIVCLSEVIENKNLQERAIFLKGNFNNINMERDKIYYLYERYLDFTLDNVLNILVEMDKRGDDNKSSVFVVSTFLYEVVCKKIFLQAIY